MESNRKGVSNDLISHMPTRITVRERRVQPFALASNTGTVIIVPRLACIELILVFLELVRTRLDLNIWELCRAAIGSEGQL